MFAKAVGARWCCRGVVELSCGLQSDELLLFCCPLLGYITDVMATKNSPFSSY